MSVTKTCLFGGALMAAGMTANAQQFVINDFDVTGAYPSFAQSRASGDINPYGDVAYAYTGGGLDTYSTAYDPGFGTGTFSTTVNSNLMRADGQWAGDGTTGYGYGISRIQAFFQVSQDADLIVSWDFSNTDNYATAVVLEEVGGATLVDVQGLAGAPAIGTQTVSLQAGVDYAFIGGLFGNAGFGSFGPFIFDSNVKFVQAELVPAPGAMGLLGFAGLAATRRRR